MAALKILEHLFLKKDRRRGVTACADAKIDKRLCAVAGCQRAPGFRPNRIGGKVQQPSLRETLRGAPAEERLLRRDL